MSVDALFRLLLSILLIGGIGYATYWALGFTPLPPALVGVIVLLLVIYLIAACLGYISAPWR